MKKLFIFSALIGAFLFSSCETKTGSGALIGGALGAGTGALIGGREGALIGGAVGALGGGLVGAALDEQDRRIMEERSPQTVEKMDRREPLTINDIIKLSEGGISDETIIRYIQETRTSYHLTQPQIEKLQKAGVSQKVIHYMVNSGQ